MLQSRRPADDRREEEDATEAPAGHRVVAGLAGAVDSKAEAVARKEVELADAQVAHSQAKTDFNAALNAFLTAIDALKEAALQIPVANGSGPPEPPAATE